MAGTRPGVVLHQRSSGSQGGAGDGGDAGNRNIIEQAVSKLADLALLADDSGKREGKGVVRGGRRQVRAILFVVASVVRRHDSNFAAFHQRLSAAGKPLKSNSHCSGAMNFWCDSTFTRWDLLARIY